MSNSNFEGDIAAPMITQARSELEAMKSCKSERKKVKKHRKRIHCEGLQIETDGRLSTPKVPKGVKSSSGVCGVKDVLIVPEHTFFDEYVKFISAYYEYSKEVGGTTCFNAESEAEAVMKSSKYEQRKIEDKTNLKNSESSALDLKL